MSLFPKQRAVFFFEATGKESFSLMPEGQGREKAPADGRGHSKAVELPEENVPLHARRSGAEAAAWRRNGHLPGPREGQASPQARPTRPVSSTGLGRLTVPLLTPGAPGCLPLPGNLKKGVRLVWPQTQAQGPAAPPPPLPVWVLSGLGPQAYRSPDKPSSPPPSPPVLRTAHSKSHLFIPVGQSERQAVPSGSPSWAVVPRPLCTLPPRLTLRREAQAPAAAGGNTCAC